MIDKDDIVYKFRFHTTADTLKGWRDLFLKKNITHYNRRDVIIEQAIKEPYLYYIVSGLVEYRYTNEDGNDTLIELLGKGCILNLQPYFGDVPIPGSFVALTECDIALMHKDEVTRLTNENAELNNALFKELSSIILGLVRQVYADSSINIEVRVEHFIAKLGEYYRKPNQNSGIVIELSQEDLARITRTAKATMTRVVSTLKKRKLLDTTYRGIIIEDLNGLMEYLNQRYSDFTIKI